jgi:hypothetical protein
MTVERRVAAGAQADLAGGTDRVRGTPSKVPGIDTLITWIPGEVIAAYSAVVLALQPSAEDGALAPLKVTARGWLIGAIVLAALLTWLGAWSKSDDLTSAQTKEALARSLFAALAFAIWSFVVPASWWYSHKWAADNVTVIPIVAGIGGLVFALFAEGIVRRVGK